MVYDVNSRLTCLGDFSGVFMEKVFCYWLLNNTVNGRFAF